MNDPPAEMAAGYSSQIAGIAPSHRSSIPRNLRHLGKIPLALGGLHNSSNFLNSHSKHDRQPSSKPRANSVYELCTSEGFSGLIRHFRPLITL